MRIAATLFVAILASWAVPQCCRGKEPQILIEVHLNRSADVAAWEITLSASGLTGELSSFSLELQNWGDWSIADSLFLRNLQSNVDLKRANNETLKFYPVASSESWDGTLKVRYKILMMDGNSKARETFGLMPWNKQSYGLGYTSNTLFEVYQNGTPVMGQRNLRFTASSADEIVLGWGPIGRNTVEFQSESPLKNTLVAFGKPTEVLRSNTPIEIELIQFGGNAGLGKRLKPKLDKLYSSLTDTFGFPGAPPKIILTDTLGGGTNVGRVMSVGYDPAGQDEESILLTAAHELFHEWLGADYLQVVQPESVWFMEGFTEYFSAWYLAHAGLISEQRFVDRIAEWQKRLEDNPLIGQVAFGDSNGDGAYEQLAYNGGALVAFVSDVACRESGHNGLSKLILDLARKQEPVDNSTLENWFRQNGLTEHYDDLLADTYRIDLTHALQSIGCKTELASTPVAYAGFSTKDQEHFGTIDQVDPDGPAAKAGVMFGDLIRGYWPHKPRELTINKAKRPKFDYGLTSFPLNESIHLEVNRDGKDLEFSFKAKSLNDVGLVQKWIINAGENHPFFK